MTLSHLVQGRTRTPLIMIAIALVALAGCSSPESPENALDAANELVRSGDRTGAVVVLKSLLQDTPDNAPARVRLAEIYLALNDSASAEKEIVKAAEAGAIPAIVDPIHIRALIGERKLDEALERLADLRGNSEDKVYDLLYAQAKLAQRKLDEAQIAYEDYLKQVSGDPEAQIGMAKILMMRSDLEGAESYLQASLAADPESVEALILDGQLKQAMGFPTAAYASYSEAARLNPFLGAALSGQVRALIAQKKYDETSALLEAAKRRFPQNSLVSYWQGVTYYYTKEYKLATEKFREVLSDAPNNRPASFYMGAAMFHQGQLAQAEDHLRQLLRNAPDHPAGNKLLVATKIRLRQPEEALKVLDQSLAARPDDAETANLRASALLMLGRRDEAMAVLDAAAAAMPEDDAVRVARTMARLTGSEAESTVAELNEQIEDGSATQTGHSLLIVALIRQGLWDRAIAMARAAIARFGDSVGYYNALGAAYLGSGDHAQARAAITKALEIDENSIEAARNLTVLEIEARDFEKADAALRKLEQLAPNDHKTVTAAGRLAFERGDLTEAVAKYDAARSLSPDALEARLRLGQVYLLANQPQLAVEAAREAIDVAPQQLAPRTLLIDAYRNSGNLTEALSAAQEAISLSPDTPELHYVTGMLYLDSGAVDKARAELERATELSQGKSPMILAGEARLAIVSGDWAAAEQAISQLEGLANQQSQASDLRGDLALRKGDPEAAITHYAKAAKSPAPPLSVLKLHGARVQAGKLNESIADLERRVAERPRQTHFQLLLGQSYEAAGRKKDAISTYEKILAEQPRSVFALNNLALLYLDADDDRSLQTARQARELAPNNPDVMDTYGWILTQRGEQLERARALLRNAVDARPDDPETRYHYATALLKSGDKEKALEQVVIALKHDTFASRDKTERLRRALDR